MKHGQEPRWLPGGWAAPLAAGVCVLLSLAGCGGGGGNGTPPDSTPPEISGGPAAEVHGDSPAGSTNSPRIVSRSERALPDPPPGRRGRGDRLSTAQFYK